MTMHRLIGPASAALGIGIAATALLGPLWLDVIRQHISPDIENQVVGADAVSLLVVAPLALAGGWLWWREHRLAPAVTFGPAAYAAYIYVQYIAGSEFERYPGNSEQWFPLFFAILLLGIVVAVASWSQLEVAALPSRRVVVAAAVVMIGVGSLLGLAWVKAIADVIGGTKTAEYLDAPGLFWLVKTMDLALVIPAAIATGVGLLRGSRAASRAASGVTSWLALMMASVAAMGAVMWANDDPSATPAFVVVLVPAALAMGLLTVAFWRARLGVPSRPDIHRPRVMPPHPPAERAALGGRD